MLSIGEVLLTLHQITISPQMKELNGSNPVLQHTSGDSWGGTGRQQRALGAPVTSCLSDPDASQIRQDHGLCHCSAKLETILRGTRW